MIPTKKEEVQIESTVSGESVRMRIDHDATEHIIALLTDLYSDPEMAIIREVSTNAKDAHTEAGQTRPIEVWTPTAISPTYVVQDWGIGLNADDFRNIYSLYGKSTKTNTNEQTGSLGLGCKSPLTYTNQFTVVGVKNGVKTSALISRDEDGIPVLDIVDESPTDEDNGAKVVIAAKGNFSSLKQKASRFFQFWPAGSVLLDGKDPTGFEGELKVSDRISLISSGRNNGLYNGYIVMCNVPYPIEKYRLTDHISEEDSIVIYVDPGEVHFTPSREALNYTKRTERTLSLGLQEFDEAILKAAQDEIDACKTYPEALAKNLDLNDRVRVFVKGAKHFTYKGEEIPFQLEHPHRYPSLDTAGKPALNPDGTPMTHAESMYWIEARLSATVRKSISTVKYISASYFTSPDAVLWVHNFALAQPTPNAKKKIHQWCSENNRPIPQYIGFSAHPFTHKWVNPNMNVDWDLIKVTKLPNGPKKQGYSMVGTYDLVRKDATIDHRTPVAAISAMIKPDVPLLYCDGDYQAINYARKLIDLDVYDDFNIAIVPYNREGKFLRIFPQAIRARVHMRELFDMWWEFMDEKTKRGLATFYEPNRILEMLNGNVIDPYLKKAKRSATIDVSHYVEQAKKFNDSVLHTRLDGYRTGNVQAYIKKNYPLFKEEYYARQKALYRKHNTIYVNAVYKEQNA